MAFDPTKWPNAMTIADLMERALPMGLHCGKCGRHVVVDPARLPFAPERHVPSLEGCFQ
jgi:hypothetical protein